MNVKPVTPKYPTKSTFGRIILSFIRHKRLLNLLISVQLYGSQ